MTETISIKAPHGWGASIDLDGLHREWDYWYVRGETRQDAIDAAIGYLEDEEIEGPRKVALGPVELISDSVEGVRGSAYVDNIMERLGELAADGCWGGASEDDDYPTVKDTKAAQAELDELIRGWLAKHLDTELWRVRVTEHLELQAELTNDDVDAIAPTTSECPANCAHLRPVGPSNCVRACVKGVISGSEECRKARDPAATDQPRGGRDERCDGCKAGSRAKRKVPR